MSATDNNNLAKKRRKWNVKVVERRENVENMMSLLDDDTVRIGLIQSLIPAGLKLVQDELMKEVELLAGRRYSRDNENSLYHWGRQNGSVYLADQKVPIMVPRVRKRGENGERRLESYARLQEPYKEDKQLLLKLLSGISTRKYEESVKLVPGVFGLSAANLSKRFRKGTTNMLRELRERDLSKYDIIAVIMDGKTFAEEEIIVALGVTIDGRKVALGIEQTATENKTAIKQFINKLIERGLNYRDGLLFVIDGSKGIIAAVKEFFKEYALIQRCQFHKRENVVSYLNCKQATHYKYAMQNAYKKHSYEAAKNELNKICGELRRINISASESLLEGMEETLTLHKLGLSRELGKSLSTTNCIESIMSQIGQYTDKVDYWQNSDQIHRWVGSSLLLIKPFAMWHFFENFLQNNSVFFHSVSNSFLFLTRNI